MCHILIVDDNPSILKALSNVFSSSGHEIVTATSGEEAIEKIRTNPPHLMLLDILMPEMDGIETLKKVREIDPGLGVFVMSALHDEDLARQAMELGAFDYITKPFDLNYLKLSVLTKATLVMCQASP